MAWALLLLAIILEVSGTICMKLSQGFTRMLPTILMFVFYGLGFIPLTLAIRVLDLSVAYAIWSGVGTAIVSIVGITLLKEHVSPWKIIFLLMIVIGVIGLRLITGQR